VALLGVLKQRRSIVRVKERQRTFRSADLGNKQICQIVFEVIAFSLASVVPELPPGEFHW